MCPVGYWVPYIFCTIQPCVVLLVPPQIGSSGAGAGVVVVVVVGLDVVACVVLWVVFLDSVSFTGVDISSG